MQYYNEHKIFRMREFDKIKCHAIRIQTIKHNLKF